VNLDELMRAGWPALEEVAVGGWVARFSCGVTQRANCVVPMEAPGDLATVEALYAERGLPTIFQIAPHSRPDGLDAVLAARGYVFGSPTSVFTAEVGARIGSAGVEIENEPSAEWLDLWWAVDGRGDDAALAIAVKILAGGPALYATMRDEAGATAVARLALVDDWGGLYCMAVRDDARRRGLGAQLLEGLLQAGHAQGVRHAWLQVRAENDGARRLYQRAGFTEVTRYHYRSHR
jgi:N-acetylglutamate synthase